MANVTVNTKVTAPTEIDIPLVRADHHNTGNIFRLFFEIFMALFSVLLGHTLSIETLQPIHYISLAVTGVAALAFILLYLYYCHIAKKGITSN